MIQVLKEGIILTKTNLNFECEGVLNPAVIKTGNRIHLFYRAVAKGNFSSIGYCLLSKPLTINYRNESPVLFPQFDYELHGVEDPRITEIEGVYYLTYTAYDGINALGAVAVSKDLINFEKQGIIVPLITYTEFKYLTTINAKIDEKYHRYNRSIHIHKKKGAKVFVWDKNLMFFPRKIRGKFYVLHRIKPDIQIVVFNDFKELTIEFWRDYFTNFAKYIVLTPRYKHEVSYIGGGCPPIETAFGWLLIYHGVHDTVKGYIYSSCAALLDLQNPEKEIARLPYPLFKPEHDWELKGEVNNVCFPTGAIVVEERLFIYYGAADERIACASINLAELINELLNYKNEK
ncbi:glycoside hydrolase family 130 protein [Polluticaenibacter yanchengensis]|uniref:Pesticidal protein Cry7Aa n=1 Tax=Polluticaenibacter yanchengensis TaxID=3014562 RepID=A0ABT4UFD1_9BACT|nr:hypothetical protein [Chitinophagaceae bacterium LY-5]